MDGFVVVVVFGVGGLYGVGVALWCARDWRGD